MSVLVNRIYEDDVCTWIFFVVDILPFFTGIVCLGLEDSSFLMHWNVTWMYQERRILDIANIQWKVPRVRYFSNTNMQWKVPRARLTPSFACADTRRKHADKRVVFRDHVHRCRQYALGTTCASWNPCFRAKTRIPCSHTRLLSREESILGWKLCGSLNGMIMIRTTPWKSHTTWRNGLRTRMSLESNGRWVGGRWEMSRKTRDTRLRKPLCDMC